MAWYLGDSCFIPPGVSVMQPESRTSAQPWVGLLHLDWFRRDAILKGKKKGVKGSQTSGELIYQIKNKNLKGKKNPQNYPGSKFTLVCSWQEDNFHPLLYSKKSCVSSDISISQLRDDYFLLWSPGLWAIFKIIYFQDQKQLKKP